MVVRDASLGGGIVRWSSFQSFISFFPGYYSKSGITYYIFYTSPESSIFLTLLSAFSPFAPYYTHRLCAARSHPRPHQRGRLGDQLHRHRRGAPPVHRLPDLLAGAPLPLSGRFSPSWVPNDVGFGFCSGSGAVSWLLLTIPQGRKESSIRLDPRAGKAGYGLTPASGGLGYGCSAVMRLSSSGQ